MVCAIHDEFTGLGAEIDGNGVYHGLREGVSPRPRIRNLLIGTQKSRKQLQAMIDNRELDEKDARTMFRDLLDSGLPPEEKTIERMWHDGQVFNIAGTETTSWTLANCTFYLLSNPEMLQRMQDEIKTVMPDGTIDNVSVSELEALPYLVRCPLNEQNIANLESDCSDQRSSSSEFRHCRKAVQDFS